MKRYCAFQERIKEPVDTIAAFFCINLFSREDVEMLIKMLDDKGKKGGHFVGICLTKIGSYDNTRHLFL